jgi:3-hydroxyacyl-CoA dehydrogenase
MATKHRPSNHPTIHHVPAPQSHVRIKEVPERAVELSVDEELEALWKLYEADEITLDEATEEIKRIGLADARKNLGDADYEALAEFSKTMLVE